MKRVAAYLLFALTSLQFLSWTVAPWVGLRQVRERSRVEASHSESSLSVFHFSKKEFEKKRFDRREFWHEGQLFDFERIEPLPGDSVRVTAHHDAHEQEFLKKIGTFFSLRSPEQTPGDAGFALHFARFLGECFLLPEAVLPGGFAADPPARRAFLFFEILKSNVPPTNEPPPDVAAFLHVYETFKVS